MKTNKQMNRYLNKDFMSFIFIELRSLEGVQITFTCISDNFCWFTNCRLI